MRRGEANALICLGNRYSETGEHRRALELYEQALVIVREIGDRRNEGYALLNLSLIYVNFGDLAAAVQAAEASHRIREEIEDPRAAGTRARLDRLRAQLAQTSSPDSPDDGLPA